MSHSSNLARVFSIQPVYDGGCHGRHFPLLVNNPDGPVPAIFLHLVVDIAEANQPLDVESSNVWIHGDLVIRNDLYAIVLPHTHAIMRRAQAYSYRQMHHGRQQMFVETKLD